MSFKKLLSFVALIALVMIPLAAMADSVTPTSFSATISVGGTASVDKTVTIDAGSAETRNGDVFFLCDTTGSMGGTITSVQSGASAILTGLSAYGNIATGAGNYQDFPTSPWGGSDDLPYILNSAIGAAAATQTGISNWSLGWGNDGPESNLYALQQATISASTGWRVGSEKFIIWFGDAVGHEPSSTPGYPGPSTAATIASLTGAGVTVFAFDVGAMDGSGQVTAITSATGGVKYTSLGTSVVTSILDAIEVGFDEYSTIALDLSEVPVGLLAAYSGAITGDFNRSSAETFDFYGLTFTGLAAGVYDFNVYVTLDGGRIATESEHIVVTGGTSVPEPASMLLLGLGLLGLVGARRKMAK